MDMPHSTKWGNFIIAETIANYWARSGDENPIHWDEDFINEHPRYKKIGIGAPIVPGVKIAEKAYQTIKPVCAWFTKSGLWLYCFQASFRRSLFYTDFLQCLWSNPEMENNVVKIKAKVLKNRGEGIADLHFTFKISDIPFGLEHFSILFQAAGAVWHSMGIGILLQNASATFHREVEAYEGIYVELNGKPKRPYGNQHRVQLNLDANSITKNDTPASFTVECRDCTNILHMVH